MHRFNDPWPALLRLWSLSWWHILPHLGWHVSSHLPYPLLQQVSWDPLTIFPISDTYCLLVGSLLAVVAPFKLFPPLYFFISFYFDFPYMLIVSWAYTVMGSAHQISCEFLSHGCDGNFNFDLHRFNDHSPALLHLWPFSWRHIFPRVGWRVSSHLPHPFMQCVLGMCRKTVGLTHSWDSTQSIR